MAQRKRTGLITPGSLDRNQLSLLFFCLIFMQSLNSIIDRIEYLFIVLTSNSYIKSKKKKRYTKNTRNFKSICLYETGKVAVSARVIWHSVKTPSTSILALLSPIKLYTQFITALDIFYPFIVLRRASIYRPKTVVLSIKCGL